MRGKTYSKYGVAAAERKGNGSMIFCSLLSVALEMFTFCWFIAQKRIIKTDEEVFSADILVHFKS